jgi:hypothetical protein
MGRTSLSLAGVIRLAIARLGRSELVSEAAHANEDADLALVASQDDAHDTHAIRKLAAQHQLLQAWPVEALPASGVTVKELLGFAFGDSSHSPVLERFRTAIRGVTYSKDEPSPSSIGGVLREMYRCSSFYDGFRITKRRTRTGAMLWKVERVDGKAPEPAIEKGTTDSDPELGGDF